MQAQLLPGTDRGVELYLGDVFQFSTLPSVMEGCNAVIVATGSKDRLNPFGPYNIDYQVSTHHDCSLFHNLSCRLE